MSKKKPAIGPKGTSTHTLSVLSVQVALSQVKMTNLDYWGPRSPLNITSGNILANFVYFICFYTRYLISKNLRASSRRARSAKSIRSLLMALKTKHQLVKKMRHHYLFGPIWEVEAQMESVKIIKFHRLYLMIAMRLCMVFE